MTAAADPEIAAPRLGSPADEVVAGADTGRIAELGAVAIAMAVGAFVRLVPVVASRFPLNDGGLFTSMIEDVRRTGVPIPTTTSYNGASIPFAYPPLAFDAAALGTLVPGVDATTLVWLVPAVISVLTVPALYLLAREILSTRFHAFVATLAFALVPRSFEWLVMGGGITRAPGLLLAMLAVWAALRAVRGRSVRAAIATGVLAGLAGLTHPQSVEFVAIAVVAIAVAECRSWRQVTLLAVSAAIGAALVLPWVVVVLSAHGPGPLLSAGSVGADPVHSLYFLFAFDLTDEAFSRPVAILGLIGLLFELSRRRWLLPAWLVLLVLIDPHNAATTTMVPMSMLAAVGVVDVLVERLAPGATRFDVRSVWPPPVVHRRGIEALLVALLVAAVAGALAMPVTPGWAVAVPADARAAMRWVADETPADASFIVVSGRPWFADATAEWFPVLADRTSVASVQGSEWLGRDAWTARLAAAGDLATCATLTVTCLDAWRREHGDATYVFVPKGGVAGLGGPTDCCIPLRETMGASSGYEIVYDGPGATIARIEAP